MKRVFFIYLIWIFILILIVFSLLSRKSVADENYGLTKNSKGEPLLRNFTVYLYVSQKKYQAKNWRITLEKAEALVNNTLGISAIKIGYPNLEESEFVCESEGTGRTCQEIQLIWNDEKYCEKDNNLDDLCFYTFTPIRNSTIISGDTVLRSEGIQAIFNIHLPGTEILESDISIYRQEDNYFKPLDVRTTYIIAHEMFHALGFDHVDKTETIMNVDSPIPTKDNPIACADPEQIKEWKKEINNRGGFYEGYGQNDRHLDNDPIMFNNID